VTHQSIVLMNPPFPKGKMNYRDWLVSLVI